MLVRLRHGAPPTILIVDFASFIGGEAAHVFQLRNVWDQLKAVLLQAELTPGGNGDVARLPQHQDNATTPGILFPCLDGRPAATFYRNRRSGLAYDLQMDCLMEASAAHAFKTDEKRGALMPQEVMPLRRAGTSCRRRRKSSLSLRAQSSTLFGFSSMQTGHHKRRDFALPSRS